MQIYPSVYIDDDNNWHEDYWFLNFYEELHCLDKKKSKILTIDYSDEEDDDLDEEDDDLEVVEYRLDSRILGGIPEEKRLMFKIGGTNIDYIFIHQKLVDIFMKRKFTGIRFLPVSTFKEGDQF